MYIVSFANRENAKLKFIAEFKAIKNISIQKLKEHKSMETVII
jgi:hypothetical protein